MNEIKRMQQLAEIKINKPPTFIKIPLTRVKQELLRNELEWKNEVYLDSHGEEMTQEDINQTKNIIENINDYYDFLKYFESEGFNRAEAMEQIFLLLVDKDA